MDNDKSLVPIGENTELIKDPLSFVESAMQFQQVMMLYESGIKQITTKLDILNSEFNARHKRNPIESVKSRIKEPMSIIKKLEKKKLPVSLANMTNNIYDIAGIRVVCPFISDIYYIAQMLTSQDDISVLEVKDYIASPKENGYRSLHLVVRVGVYFSDQKRDIIVELQIRTIAMNFWASLDHQLRYKKDVKITDKIKKELKECADVIAETDVKMQNIANELPSFRNDYRYDMHEEHQWTLESTISHIDDENWN